MAVTVTLGFASSTILRYEVDQDGTEGQAFIIPNAGGASPDLLTDALAGAAFSQAPSGLVAIMNAARNGYGPLPVGGLTALQAKQLLQGSFAFGAADVLTNGNVVYASCNFYMNDYVTGARQGVAVAVDGSGNPTLAINTDAGALRSVYMLEIILREPGRS